MLTIAMTIQKGGTGKTTTSVSFAAEFARHGKTVIIDADPQGTASSWLNPQNIQYELADYFLKKVDASGVVAATNVPNLDIVPTFGVGGFLKSFSETQGVANPYYFMDLLDDLNKLGYQYAIIDLSPAFGTFERNALIASDEAITPIIPDPNGIDGLQIFISRLQEAKHNMRTEKPAYRKIIINQYNKSIAQHVAYTEMIFNSLSANYNIYKIPVDQAFSKSRAANIPVQEFKETKAETRETITKIINDILGK